MNEDRKRRVAGWTDSAESDMETPSSPKSAESLHKRLAANAQERKELLDEVARMHKGALQVAEYTGQLLEDFSRHLESSEQ